MRKLKFPLWLRKKLLTFFDDNPLPTHLRGEGIFTMMFNYKIRSIRINKKCNALLIVYQNGLWIEKAVERELLISLHATIIDMMHMDKTIEDYQEKTTHDIGIIICPCQFHCTQDSEMLTLTAEPIPMQNNSPAHSSP